MFFIEHFRGVSPVSVHGRSVSLLGEKVISAVLTGSMIASGIIALSPSRRQESQLSIDMIYVVTKLKESMFHNVLGKSACLDVLPVMGVR